MVPDSPLPFPPELQKLSLFAWVGEDEIALDKPGFGIKRIVSPCGGIVAAVMPDIESLRRPGIVQALVAQAAIYRKSIHLCRFNFVERLAGIDPVSFK